MKNVTLNGTEYAIINTAKELTDHITAMIESATMTLEGVHCQDSDFGDWINATLTLSDGSTVAYGWWLYADANGLNQTDADLIRRYGYAITAYGWSDIIEGDLNPSADLSAHFERVVAAGGPIELPDGNDCDDASDLLARMVANADIDDTEAEECWLADLKEAAGGKVKDADIGDLLKMLQH